MAEDQHSRRALRQSPESRSQKPSVVSPLDRHSGIDGFRGRQGQLLAAATAAIGPERVERHVRRRCAHPTAGPRLLAALAPMERKEGVLGHVLGPGAIAEDASGNPDHLAVFGAKDAIKRPVSGRGGGGRGTHAPDSLSIHIHTAPPLLIL